MNKTTNDFISVVLGCLPLVDLRAPVEFEKGTFPNAVNLPLMSDEERHLVGTCYKNKGHDAAVALGHELVTGKTKEERVLKWIDFFKTHPEGMLFCFRGGQRSQIAQEWIEEATGTIVPRLEGGYKAFRQFLIQSMEPENLAFEPLVLTGNTGSAKTILLQAIPNAVDLEGLANHRGSSFGGNATPQPTQINFENSLAYKLIQLQHEGYPRLVFEDESRNIGRSYLPKSLFEYIKSGKYVLVEVELDKRIDNIHQDYIHDLQEQYQQIYGDDLGLEKWKDSIESALNRIQKRLGSENHQDIMNCFQNGYDSQVQRGDYTVHRSWIRLLLERYYDPMYNYQITKKSDRILFRGSYDEVLSYLKEQAADKK